VWAEGREKRRQQRMSKRTKNGQFALSMGPSRAEVDSFVQTATISSKRVSFTVINATHGIILFI
jgi:hypothetical protein